MDIGIGEFAFVLFGGVRSVLSFKELLAVRVQVEFGDDDLGRVDTQVNGGAIVLFPVDSFNVNDELLSVHGGDFAITVFEGTADNLDFIILADGERSDLISTDTRGKNIQNR